ncbi:MAG: THUMP domain-containing protein [Burkholderiales bacterium]|nr:THUMP domain-containing protein [Burkholderiales bacterium]
MSASGFFATCPRGLEPALARELAACGAADPTAVGGGVRFAGDLAVCYRANLESRIASRVLLRVAHGAYATEQDVYEAGRAIRWADWFDVDRSIRVDVGATRSPLRSLEFATLRIKDAVCDRFRADVGRRPDVDTRAPGVRIHAYLDERSITLYLDTSGEPLWKRGARADPGEAPLRENLAAGILALAGWTLDEPLLDPMCGSGTFLAEAAAIAHRIAPGARRQFGFERLRNFDSALWTRLREAARARELPPRPRALYGADRDPAALARATRTLAQLGLAAAVRLERADVLEIAAPGGAGVLVANPPYGVRIGEDATLAAFYPKLGDALKARFVGWRCYILSADLRLAKLIGLKASRRTPLFNGALECRLFEYRIVAGGMRRARPASG